MKKGFSLVELLVSLIIISLIVAIFAPIMTKRLVQTKTAVVSKISSQCDVLSPDCKLCITASGDKKCLLCEKKCSEINMFLNKEKCICENCSALNANCEKCADGKCLKCKAGYGLALNGKCTSSPCESGTYSDGSHSCTACAKGTFSTGIGSSVCEKCPKGYYCLGGSSLTLCPAGTYGAVIGAQSQADCTSCPTGYYCLGGTNKTPCGAGKRNSTEGATNSSFCIPCLAGTYQPYDSSSVCYMCNGNYQYSNSSGAKTCSVCPAGQMANSSGTGCVSCPQGMVCDGNSIKTCASNQYADSSTNSCKVCPDGYYSSNMSGCIPCEKGFKCSNGVKSACVGDTYAPAGSSECSVCNSGYVNDDHSECKSCNNYGGSACLECDELGCVRCASGYILDKDLDGTVLSGKYGCYMDNVANRDLLCKKKIGAGFFLKTGVTGKYITSGICIDDENAYNAKVSANAGLTLKWFDYQGGDDNVDSTPTCWHTGGPSTPPVYNHPVCNSAGAAVLCRGSFAGNNIRPISISEADLLVAAIKAGSVNKGKICSHQQCGNFNRCSGAAKNNDNDTRVCRPGSYWALDYKGSVSAINPALVQYVSDSNISVQAFSSSHDRANYAASVRCVLGDSITYTNLRYNY